MMKKNSRIKKQIFGLVTAKRSGDGFTLIELLIVIAIIALLMGILLPALTRVRRQGKRAACLAHTKQLQTAWQAYAETYDGKPVNGGQAPPARDAAGYTTMEKYWCTGFPTTEIPGYDWNWSTTNFVGSQLTYKQRVEKMKEGSLWPYLKDEKIYRCTEARKDFHRTWSIVQSMNSNWPGLDQYFGGQGKVITNLGQIKKATERIVFIEEGQPSSDAFMVIYNVATSAGNWRWIDKPQAPHVKGSNFSFADGHAEFRKWEEKRTLSWAGVDWTDESLNLSSLDIPHPNSKDLLWVVRAVWGGVKGYP